MNPLVKDRADKMLARGQTSEYWPRSNKTVGSAFSLFKHVQNSSTESCSPDKHKFAWSAAGNKQKSEYKNESEGDTEESIV